MSDTSRLIGALRVAITCLPLLSSATSCEKAGTDVKPPSDPKTPTTKSIKPEPSTPEVTAKVPFKKSTCGPKHNTVISSNDAEKLPHAGASVLGCPSTLGRAAAAAVGLVPEFGDLRGISLSVDCTTKERASDPNACVYVADILYPPEGRPAIEAGEAVLAPLRTGATWRRGAAVNVDQLAPAERQKRAEQWLAAARAEHASIASFARATMELMAAGAPPGLVAASLRAAADEVRHAELSFAIASAYAGRAMDPGPMPALAARGGGLAELVRTTFREGCVAETAAALRAERALADEQDEVVRAALTIIARDESRHAELAWQTIAWALAAGGDATRIALDEAVREAASNPPRDAWESVILPSLALLA